MTIIPALAPSKEKEAKSTLLSPNNSLAISRHAEDCKTLASVALAALLRASVFKISISTTSLLFK